MFRYPIISVPAKFLARITTGAIWGIFLSPFDLTSRFVFAGILSVIAAFLYRAFWAWDRQPVTLSRISLYGLLGAGEALGVGAVVFAALGAFTGHVHVLPLMLCGFGGALLPMYINAVLYRDNILKGRGSKH
jgi:hypothetical protein